MKPLSDLECCPPFHAEAWDDKIHDWKEKNFIREKVCTFFFMPLNFGQVMKRVFEKVNLAGAGFADHLGLSYHTSRWNMELLIAVDREIAGAENITLSGNFYSRVYEGPYSDTGKFCNDFDAAVKVRGLACKKRYMWYVYCPKCAKKYGKNYTVILAGV